MNTLFTLSRDILIAQVGPYQYVPGSETLHTMWRKILDNQGGAQTSGYLDPLPILWRKVLKNLGGQVACNDNPHRTLYKIARLVGAELRSVETLYTLLLRIRDAGGIPGRDWILATGSWDDEGIWIDTETWNDGGA